MQKSALYICFLIAFLFLHTACQNSYSPPAEIAVQLPERVDFNFHIKPILSDRCFPCHGPDKNALQADLQLHTREGALEHVLESGQRAFTGGSLQKSEAFQRMISIDPEQHMPPPEFQRRLSPYEIALFAKWIDQGAAYKPHWAFIPPTKTTVPSLSNEEWCKNPIDYFVLTKLTAQHLAPNKQADKEILLRRVSFDLTGLPPTLTEIDNFLADKSPHAYEKVVDRLLASSHFGERMALFWLDIARYADSNGYSQDGLRLMWPWRDWVIKAFNAGMPYDQFLTWQIAGDKLPQATQEQKLATGFLRNHRLNGEGGIVDEEYRVEYVADRAETTATAFLGLTFQCARCHDHKYDPISQEEYFQFFSFFNSVHESGISANDRNSGPELVLTSKAVAARIDFIDELIAAKYVEANKVAEGVSPELYQHPKPDLDQGVLVDLSFDNIREGKLVNGINPRETFEFKKSIEYEKGAFGKALPFSTFDFINISKKQLGFDRADPFSFSFYVKTEQKAPSITILNLLGSTSINSPGYEIALVQGRPTIRLAHSLPANLIEVSSEKAIRSGEWLHLTVSYDGSGKAAGISIYQDGEKQATTQVYDKLTQSIASNRKTLKIGGRTNYQIDINGKGIIDELKIYNRQLSDIEAYFLFHHSDPEIDPFPPDKRKAHFLANKYQPYKQIMGQIQEFRKEQFQIQDTLISVMVMEDLPQMRPTFVLARGAYDAPMQQVYPGMPKALLSFPKDGAQDRLGLSKWLTASDNPLTARVAVNRFWQLYFGHGIVKTTENFGNQGSLPSHPELLDWLAATFIESGWDVKALLKTILLSATYQQSSRVSLQERANDPDNTLLARGPSRRLSAELIRDCALVSSGLLEPKIAGPSVKPYQPAGLWEEKGEFSQLKNYRQDQGQDLYRRSLYTFWRRSSPPPSMTTFDAPTRDVCIVSRQETNTPLQALVLLNDPTFVEAARILAEKVIRNIPDKTDQIIHAHRLLTGLRPNPEVLTLLSQLAEKEYRKFYQQPERVKQLMQVGDYPYDKSLDLAEVAAMTIVSSTIMSFDETLVKR